MTFIVFCSENENCDAYYHFIYYQLKLLLKGAISKKIWLDNHLSIGTVDQADYHPNAYVLTLKCTIKYK